MIQTPVAGPDHLEGKQRGRSMGSGGIEEVARALAMTITD
jgi:hypothetical protein